MSDFIANNNNCGQNLLRLVSRGNAILAELMRLKEYVPPVFRLDTKQHIQQYSSIILDFVYFKSANLHEQKIENDPILQERDENLRENYSDVLTRFYLAFESIHKYITELNNYVDDLEDNVYIQQSLESVMLNDEGKQLLCEALYLYGVMLLLVDHQFEGQIRERLIVSYYRYNAQNSSSSKIDDICLLLRSTGYTKTLQKRPLNYPDDYFKRIPIKLNLIDLLIGKLRSDDIYNQTIAFPNPDNRSIASANQASMLVIILLFKPSILNNNSAIMREIVDRFFPDNWVISIYMGIIINLYDLWLPYKSAKIALNNTLDMKNIKLLCHNYRDKMNNLIIECKKLHINEKFDDNDNTNDIDLIIKLIRETNICLHWLLLHTTIPTIMNNETKYSRQLRQQIINDTKYTNDICLNLLLYTAKIEQDLKLIYKNLLNDKLNKWLNYKNKCVFKINELSDVFSGKKKIVGIEINTCLENWFKNISQHVNILNEDDNRKIVQLLQALEEVQEFHQLEHNLQITQCINETRNILINMLKLTNINENTLISINIMTDCCYAWNIMNKFINIMQDNIKLNPPNVIKLKALFLKMSSALETPLLRINQAKSPDLISVSQYYSRELENYARNILQIIPETIFGLLGDIVNLETNIFKEIPTKLYKDKLKDYAQLNERLKMAKLTYTVSIFTNGVLSLKSVSLGILRVDSNKLLEDGIRKELVKNITQSLHNNLIFDNNKNKYNNLIDKLNYLIIIMDGYRKAFQYIQDYININSLKIWHEEVTYIINIALEDELKNSTWIPGKSLKNLLINNNNNNNKNDNVSIDNNNNNNNNNNINCDTFLGRLAKELIKITDPKLTIYIEHTLSWYDLKNQNELLNYKIFSLILKAIGTPGLYGLDKLLSHYIYQELININKHINLFNNDKNLKIIIDESLLLINNDNKNNNNNNSGKLCNYIINYGYKIWHNIIDCLLKIGNYQLLRYNISYELNTVCKFEAKHMESSLRTFNNALLYEFKKNSNKQYINDDENQLIKELSIRLEWTGINDPLNKKFIQFLNYHNFDCILFLFTIYHLHKLYYCKNTASLLSKKIQDPIDAIVFTIGIHTLLRQFPNDIIDKYIKLLCNYVLTFVSSESGKISNEWETEATTIIYYLQLLSKYLNIPKLNIFKNIPVIVIDQYKKIIIK